MQSLTEILSKCFPTSSTVFTRQNRISPESSARNHVLRRLSDPNPAGTFRSEELTGEINIHYVGDDVDESHVVIECPNLSEFPPESPPTENEPVLPFDSRRRKSVVDPNDTYGNGSNSYFTTIFIETAKNKTLRVVHYRALDNDQDELDGDISSESDGDGEEYWFSKWSTRPRLKRTPEEQNIEMRLKIAADEKQNNVGWKQKFIGSKVDSEGSGGGLKKNVSFSMPPSTPPPANAELGEQVDSSMPKTVGNEQKNSFTNLAFQFDENDGETRDETNGGGSHDISNGDAQLHAESGCGDEASSIQNDNNNSGSSVRGVTDVKPLLFFIHSISGSSDSWRSQINYFHKLGYEIAAMDLLGHGLSGTPPQSRLYHFESLVQDTVVVFDHFIQDNEHRQAVVIGHGYGACLATVLTRIRPKNVSILVSISGGGPTPMVASYWCDIPWIPIPCTFLPKKKKKGRFINPELKHVLPRNVQENIILGQIWLDGDPAFHRRITVPTLLVYGLRDKVVNLVEVCEMERTIPRAYLELIPTAGHMVMWDEPRQLNRMLRMFIEAKWS